MFDIYRNRRHLDKNLLIIAIVNDVRVVSSFLFSLLFFSPIGAREGPNYDLHNRSEKTNLNFNCFSSMVPLGLPCKTHFISSCEICAMEQSFRPKPPNVAYGLENRGFKSRYR